MGNNPSRSGYGNAYGSNAYGNNPSLAYPPNAAYLPQSMSQGGGYGRRRYRSENYGIGNQSGYGTGYQSGYGTGYPQAYTQPQAQYMQGQPQVMQAMPMVVPPPGVVYPQQQMPQAYVQQAGGQAQGVQPTFQMPVPQNYPGPTATMQMPQPNITGQPPVIPPPPVIPSQGMGGGPVVPPMPQLRFPEPQPAPPPGQYGSYEPQSDAMNDTSRMFNHNPLPAPPQNILIMSPFRHTIRKLREHEDIEDPLANLRPGSVQPGQSGSVSSNEGRQRRRKGLFGAFGHRRAYSEQGYAPAGTPAGMPTLRGVYAGPPTLQQMPDGSAVLVYNPPPQMVQVSAGAGAVPFPAATAYPPAANPSGAASAADPQQQAMQQIKVHRDSQWADLLQDSSHDVRYQHKRYPTALHLFEAMKFLGHREDIAWHVRHAQTLDDATRVSDENAQHVRPDWGEIVVQQMEECLYLKIKQHPSLRHLLLTTGAAELIYSEADDFWGDGSTGQGVNHLGRCLMRIRNRLHGEGYAD